MDSMDVVKNLVNGRDPADLSPLGDEQVVCQPAVRDALRELLVKTSRPKNGPAKAGVRWDDEEDQQLTERFATNRDVKALADLHGRSPAAIEARLIRLELMPSDQARFWREQLAR